ncbi:MAG: FGGY-family carbohydrate kinase [Acidimicrobiia bacterium]
MSDPFRVLAVDLGATSVRVAAVDMSEDQPSVEILHRWEHSPIMVADGSLRWDWPRIVSEVEAGLEQGIATAEVASIGIDGWGIDYGLIDGTGRLVDLPFSYRDSRTEGWQATAQRIGLERLYERTGVQMMAINTIFQLAVHDPGELARASRILLLPDLLVHHLTGQVAAERSNVSTTALMDIRTGEWAADLVADLSLDPSLFPPVVGAGTAAGTWRGIPVHLVGSHDTASAFLGMPGGTSPGTVFVSAGTWVLVGMERPGPDTSSRAREANFSNEAGALGGIRFLKNVVGLWILEQCRQAWGGLPIGMLLEEAASLEGPVPTFDAGDHRFVSPADMVREVQEAADLPPGTPRSVIARSVIESIVGGIGAVVEELTEITGEDPARIAVVGGGARVPLLHELLSRRTGLPVVRGSQEATALGNALVQGLAIGAFEGLEQARQWLGAGDVTDPVRAGNVSGGLNSGRNHDGEAE